MDIDGTVAALLSAVDSCRPLVWPQPDTSRLTVWRKDTGHGSEPVTDIDVAIHHRICSGLRSRLPGIGCLSEEDPPSRDGATRKHELVAVIDPVDGTKAMIAGRPDFAICVALIYRGSPLAGLMEFPALGHRVLAVVGEGCWLDDRQIVLADAQVTAHPVIAVSARALVSPTVARIGTALPGARFQPMSAFSPKALSVITGRADAAMYLPEAAHPYAVWDVLAGAIALTVAGASVTDWSAEPLLDKATRMLVAGRYYDATGWVAGRSSTAGRLISLVSGAGGAAG